jgi:hypothetical protein
LKAINLALWQSDNVYQSGNALALLRSDGAVARNAETSSDATVYRQTAVEANRPDHSRWRARSQLARGVWDRKWHVRANVMRFGGRPAADGAGLGGDELAVFLLAQANGFRRNASAT